MSLTLTTSANGHFIEKKILLASIQIERWLNLSAPCNRIKKKNKNYQNRVFEYFQNDSEQLMQLNRLAKICMHAKETGHCSKSELIMRTILLRKRTKKNIIFIKLIIMSLILGHLYNI